MRSFLALAAALLTVVACGSPTTNKGPSSIADGPAAFSRGRWCGLQVDNGAPYYAELPASAKSLGMCTAAKHLYTHEEFQAILGLARQCVFDSEKEIAQNDGVVAIYSDQTPESVGAARMICTNAGH